MALFDRIYDVFAIRASRATKQRISRFTATIRSSRAIIGSTSTPHHTPPRTTTMHIIRPLLPRTPRDPQPHLVTPHPSIAILIPAPLALFPHLLRGPLHVLPRLLIPHRRRHAHNPTRQPLRARTQHLQRRAIHEPYARPARLRMLRDVPSRRTSAMSLRLMVGLVLSTAGAGALLYCVWDAQDEGAL